MHKKIKTTITLSPHIKEFASKEAKELGLDFSAYISILIAEKLRGSSITASSTAKTFYSQTDPEISVNEIESKIDTTQINELDRLLNLTGANE